VHAELFLHRFRGQADLAAHEAPTLRERMTRVGVLHGIRGVDAAGCQLVAHGRNRRAALLRGAQARSHLRNQTVVAGKADDVASKVRIRPTAKRGKGIAIASASSPTRRAACVPPR
jgi:hypothetical protein